MDTGRIGMSDSTIAVCKCGNMIMAIVTRYIEKQDERELGRLAAKGCEIKHMDSTEVQKLEWGCCCEPAQGSLLEVAK